MRNVTPGELLNALKDYYRESIFITDGEGNVVYVNRCGAERLGSTVDALLGRNVNDLTKEGVYSRSTTMIAIETKKPYVGALNPEDPNSTISDSVPVLDEDGNVVLVVTNNMSVEHSRDWTSIIEKEQALTAKLRRELDNIRKQETKSVIAVSSEIKCIYENVNLIAPTDSNVVITGESGTGKDVMARYIHNHSRRKDEAFISINCAAIPENLMESELFGYEAGAFTGASAKGKIGLFEAALGGTIFFDEIGEMPLPLQSKLLRALENREIRRVGGIKSIPISVRVICATNVDLKQLVKEKRFREDLYYRLNVFHIHIPPLRERPADILPFAQAFLDELNKKHGTLKYLSEECQENLKKYSWPGNIRELRNVIERTFVISLENALDFTITPEAAYWAPKDSENEMLNPYEYSSLKEYRDAAEKKYIEKVLSDCGGSIQRAADRLGIHRSQLYRIRKTLEI